MAHEKKGERAVTLESLSNIGMNSEFAVTGSRTQDEVRAILSPPSSTRECGVGCRGRQWTKLSGWGPWKPSIILDTLDLGNP